MASSFSLAPDFSETDSNAVSAALEFDVKKSSSAGESCVWCVGVGEEGRGGAGREVKGGGGCGHSMD